MRWGHGLSLLPESTSGVSGAVLMKKLTLFTKMQGKGKQNLYVIDFVERNKLESKASAESYHFYN